MQISGHIGKTLLDAIRESIVPRPALMGWNEWQRWRSTEGLRPLTRVAGAGNSTTNAQERQFWKNVMLELYGEDWSYQLALGQMPAEPEDESGIGGEDAEDDQEEHSAAGLPRGSPAPGAESTGRIWRSQSPPMARTTDGDGERSLARARDEVRLGGGSASHSGTLGPDNAVRGSCWRVIRAGSAASRPC